MKTLVTILLVSSLTAWGQSSRNNKVDPSDSVQVKKKIEDFYEWYAGLIKNHKADKEFSPIFVKTSDGMTSLDFSKYKDGLKKHSFTDNFIKQKINAYKPCVDNLNKIKYDTFLTFSDLDQFEEIKCDFNNVREWTADMEPHDGAELIKIVRVDRKTLSGTIQFFSINVDGKKYIWDYKIATVKFLRQGKDWKVDGLKIERL